LGTKFQGFTLAARINSRKRVILFYHAPEFRIGYSMTIKYHTLK
jgi:hypothetical protein